MTTSLQVGPTAFKLSTEWPEALSLDGLQVNLLTPQLAIEALTEVGRDGNPERGPYLGMYFPSIREDGTEGPLVRMTEDGCRTASPNNPVALLDPTRLLNEFAPLCGITVRPRVVDGVVSLEFKRDGDPIASSTATLAMMNVYNEAKLGKGARETIEPSRAVDFTKDLRYGGIVCSSLDEVKRVLFTAAFRRTPKESIETLLASGDLKRLPACGDDEIATTSQEAVHSDILTSMFEAIDRSNGECSFDAQFSYRGHISSVPSHFFEYRTISIKPVSTGFILDLGSSFANEKVAEFLRLGRARKVGCSVRFNAAANQVGCVDIYSTFGEFKKYVGEALVVSPDLTLLIVPDAISNERFECPLSIGPSYVADDRLLIDGRFYLTPYDDSKPGSGLMRDLDRAAHLRMSLNVRLGPDEWLVSSSSNAAADRIVDQFRRAILTAHNGSDYVDELERAAFHKDLSRFPEQVLKCRTRIYAFSQLARHLDLDDHNDSTSVSAGMAKLPSVTSRKSVVRKALHRMEEDLRAMLEGRTESGEDLSGYLAKLDIRVLRMLHTTHSPLVIVTTQLFEENRLSYWSATATPPPADELLIEKVSNFYFDLMQACSTDPRYAAPVGISIEERLEARLRRIDEVIAKIL